jgi:hypothetical protein
MSDSKPYRQPETVIPSNVDFIPQAILQRDIEQVAKALDVGIENGWDDLDSFKEVTFVSDFGSVPVAIRHYAGHPTGTTTIYLPFQINDIDLITRIISFIVERLHFTAEDVYWQRKDDPEL